MQEIPPRRKRRRFPIRLAIGAIVVAAAVWFAPSLVALSPLRQSIVPWLLPDLAAKVNIGSASLGWLSSLQLHNVTITDANGKPLAEGPGITLDKSLISLLFNSSDLGTIRLDQPQVHLVVREGGSNLEDALAKYFEGEPTGLKIACRVEVAQGTIELTDEAGNHGWLDELSGSADYSQAAEKSLKLRLTSRTVAADAREGVLTAEATWQTSADPKIGLVGSGSSLVKADRVPLDALSPAACRVSKDVAIVGELTCDGRVDWSAGGETQAYDIESLTARGVGLRAAQWIGPDELRCDSLDVRGKATVEQGRLKLDGVQLQSDLGEMEATGGARVEALKRADLLAAIIQEDLSLKGRLDVARLAQVLPATLRIREGTQITSGEVAFSLSSRTNEAQRGVFGKLAASKLAATNDGRRITWEQPIVLTLEAGESDAGPTIEKLEAEASFVRISGRGSLGAGSLSATGDLDRLAAELGQFVNLDPYQLAGKMRADIQWKQGPENLVEAAVDLRVENFLGALPGATRSSQGWAVGGTIHLRAAANLTPRQIEIKEAAAKLTGLQAWGNGLFIQEPELVIETSGTWNKGKQTLTSPVTNLAGSAVALRADNLTLQRGDKGFSLAGDVDYRGDLARLYSWTYDPRQAPERHIFGGVTGKLTARREGSVTRADFSTTMSDVKLAHRVLPAGGLVGRPVGATANSWEEDWSEKAITLRGAAEYDEAQDALQLSQLTLASATGNLSVQGRLAGVTSERRIDLQGDLTCDLPNLATKLRPYLGSDFELTGRDSRKFFLRGPLPESRSAGLASAGETPGGGAKSGVPAKAVSSRVPTTPAHFPADLSGAAGLGWSSARVQGLVVGQGELQARLDDGLVSFVPLDLPLAEGRLRLSPQVSLNSDPMLLSIERGRILEKVRISPEMCQTWLKYVAPLLADATRAEGRFTLDLAGAALPLAKPESGKAQGTLTVHEAQIGPGPLGQQALWIAQQVKALVEHKPLAALTSGTTGEFLKMPEQTVAFQLVDQRVYHENLTFLVRDVTIRTKGSVGIDQTLSLVAEVPVLDRWVEKDRLLSGLKGQTLHIPITGKLGQPKVDERVFEDASKHLLKGAAGNLLEGELNKGLQKLFGPKK